MSVILNRRLTLEEAERAADGAGGFVETWVARGTLWAAIEPGAGHERFAAAVRVSSTPTKIIVRGAPLGAPSRPRADQRFREGERLYAIVGVTEYDKDIRYLSCFTIEERAA